MAAVTTFPAMRYGLPLERMDPGAISWMFVLFVVVGLPLAAAAQQRALARDPVRAAGIDRGTIYVSAAITQAVLLLAAWLAMRDTGADLVPLLPIGSLAILAALAMLGIGLLPVLFPGWTDAPARERSAMIAPRTTREAIGFAGVALSAGIAEEIAYRCVLYALLFHAMISAGAGTVAAFWGAAAIGAIAFGAAHAFQGWRSAVAAGAIGLLMQLTLVFTGNVLLPIAVHVIHDLIAGFVIARRARRGVPGGAPVAV